MSESHKDNSNQSKSTQVDISSNDTIINIHDRYHENDNIFQLSSTRIGRGSTNHCWIGCLIITVLVALIAAYVPEFKDVLKAFWHAILKFVFKILWHGVTTLFKNLFKCLKALFMY